MLKHSLMAGIALVGLAAAGAQEPTGSRQSREFAQAAAASDTFEIMEAQSALAESKDPQVRDFATRMIQDHTHTSQNLMAASQRAGLEPPKMALDQGQSQMLASLQSARDKKFDALYWRQQVLAHHAALVTMQGYAQSGDQPELRQLATATTPLIQAHLGMAERMAATTSED
jgi:putative membrane protein